MILIYKELEKKIKNYLENGGKILCSGKSGMNIEKTKFVLDLGLEHEGSNSYTPSYILPNFNDNKESTSYVIYEDYEKVRI